MNSFQMAMSVAVLLLGGGVLTGSAWWIVSGVFGLRNKLVHLEGEIALVRAEIENVHERCHGREMWLRGMNDTMTKMDRTLVKLATKMEVEIDGSQ